MSESGRRIWLLVPVALTWAVDVGLTLAGQSAGYWAGDFTAADEANPLARPALARGSAAFVGLAVVWWAGLALLVLRTRPRAAFTVAAVAAAGHAIGGAAWLARYGPWGWAGATAYLAAAAEAAGWCWRRYRRAD